MIVHVFQQANSLASQGKFEGGGAAGESLFVANHAY